ncbi:ATP-binding protein [Halorhabdus sp. BNX81]|uniref:ATP-binding protein n=1 Tax=Halorhabdus sp. BNX81 TaxID=2980181 RepID=UPI0023DCFC9A|nr:ATP-binding protein [Halorhabdus sp. BNX81]
MVEFVNRDRELDRLQDLYESDSAALAVMYGRRRMGKTTLALESIRDRDDAVYYQATRGTAEQQRSAFVSDAAEAYSGITRIRDEWEPLFEYLAEQDAVVILDEFPYLVEQTEALPSILQRVWDHTATETAATFVLTGSAIGMMYEYALEGTAPLYGRVAKTPNGEIEVSPLHFAAAMEFFPEYPPAEQVMTYGIFGGTPEYLRAVNNDESLEENVTRTLLGRDGGLHEEPENVLQRELAEVDRYFAVLKSMAEGNRVQNEIAQAAGITDSSVGYYLDRLSELRVINRDYPVTVDPSRSRKGRYTISDPLFRFWFRFVYGRTARYEVYGDDAYADLIDPALPDFVSRTFEQLCQRAVLYAYGDEYRFVEEPGNWWDGSGHEIDVVAPTNSQTLLLGEAKFRQSEVGYEVLSQLRDEAQLVDWTPDDGGEREYEFALFSRSGFSQSVEEAATKLDNLRLFTVEEVVRLVTA